MIAHEGHHSFLIPSGETLTNFLTWVVNRKVVAATHEHCRLKVKIRTYEHTQHFNWRRASHPVRTHLFCK